MSHYQLILLIVLVVCTWVGYKLITRVPSLLHTPLMSGMNAFSGVTVLGCLTATAAALSTQSRAPIVGGILGFIAIVLAMVNVVGGFSVTHRMLRLFKKQPSPQQNQKGGAQK